MTLMQFIHHGNQLSSIKCHYHLIYTVTTMTDFDCIDQVLTTLTDDTPLSTHIHTYQHGPKSLIAGYQHTAIVRNVAGFHHHEAFL